MEHPWIGTFLGFWGSNSPKYGLILLKLAPKVVFNERNSVFQKVLANSIFRETARYQNLNFFSVFAQLWGPIYPMKEDEIEKTNWFQQ